MKLGAIVSMKDHFKEPSERVKSTKNRFKNLFQAKHSGSNLGKIII
jgi:hypothetical protein